VPKRLPAHMDAQRERILRSTLRCISELGIEQTSIAAIRREAKLSTGALYTHFPNKEAIVAEALRFATVEDATLPESWADLRSGVSDTSDDGLFDTALVARAQLQIFASCIRPGPLHDLLKPMIGRSLDQIVDHLAEMERDGRVRLRMTPHRTAMAIAALRDGYLWMGLALDRPFEEVEADMAAALDCLVRS
jgi:AcrR family transcriptional regulator